MTPETSGSTEIMPDPGLEKRTRRRFSAAEKLRLLTEAEGLAHGEQGAWLRRNGLYAAQLSGWRKQQASHGWEGLQPQAPGRKAGDARDRQIASLQRENSHLHRRAEVAEQLVELQRKVFQRVEKAQQERRSWFVEHVAAQRRMLGKRAIERRADGLGIDLHARFAAPGAGRQPASQ